MEVNNLNPANNTRKRVWQYIEKERKKRKKRLLFKKQSGLAVRCNKSYLGKPADEQKDDSFKEWREKGYRL